MACLVLWASVVSSLARTKAHHRTVPTAHRPTRTHVAAESADVNAVDSTSAACRSSPSTAWKTAPAAASVIAPARVRFIAYDL
jgi:hypothetical protein